VQRGCVGWWSMDWHHRRSSSVCHQQRTLRSASATVFRAGLSRHSDRPAPGSRHESLPSHDAPGVFLFEARCTNLYRCNLNRDLRPPHHLRNGHSPAFTAYPTPTRDRGGPRPPCSGALWAPLTLGRPSAPAPVPGHRARKVRSPDTADRLLGRESFPPGSRSRSPKMAHLD
jgi:hypothetical protein